MVDPGSQTQAALFAEGRAYVRMSAHVVRVSGADARGWLHDLITADVASLADGDQVRSLLLSPTGRIRADVHVIARDGAFVLVQDAAQPEPIDTVLLRYVLSSDVRLERLSATAPVVVADGDVWRVALVPPAGMDEVPVAAFEAWRVRRGLPRFPADVDADSTPAEGRLEPLIDLDKGCFLGQESVAKIRNLGHPARLVLPLSGPPGVRPGDAITANGERAGVVTSVVEEDVGSAVLGRVAWAFRDRALETEAGGLAPR